MQIRWRSGVAAVIGALVIAVLSLSGCGSTKCLDCGGENPCPSLGGGTYVCEQVATMETCRAWMLVEGPTWIRVVEQDGNRLLIEKTTTYGDWYTYEGEVCNTNKQTSPRYYSFWASQDTSEAGSDERVMYTLNGSFFEDQVGVPGGLDATITLQLFELENTQAVCTLSGTVDCTFELE